jgi:hypothetical protein
MVSGYNGFRKTIIKRATLEDTLQNMQRIAIRDQDQVAELASSLTGDTTKETCENIWMWLRKNTRYKLDRPGYEELRTPARSVVDGEKGLHNPDFGIDCDDYTILVSAMLLSLGIRHEYRVAAYEQKGKFQHIYSVAFDDFGNEYVIDAVPASPKQIKLKSNEFIYIVFFSIINKTRFIVQVESDLASSLYFNKNCLVNNDVYKSTVISKHAGLVKFKVSGRSKDFMIRYIKVKTTSHEEN